MNNVEFYTDSLTQASESELYSSVSMSSGQSLILNTDLETMEIRSNAESKRATLAQSMATAYYQSYTGILSYSSVSDAYFALSKYAEQHRFIGCLPPVV